MIIVKLKGGLGNQLFQYAMGRKLSILNRDELKFDIGASAEVFQKNTAREYKLGYFNTKGTPATADEVRRLKYPFGIISKAWRAFTFWGLKIHNIDYHPEYLKKKGNVYLDGFWQSEKYFLDIREALLEELTLKNTMTAKAKKVESDIETAEHPVSIHIRRGDYVLDPGTNKWHGNICSLEYYAKAIELITDKVTHPTFFVFSDDIEWVKENLKCPQPVIYVSQYGLEDYEELILMSKCHHHIIANSSFSWWGAWLNRYKGKTVIAPPKWTNVVPNKNPNILPPKWITLTDF
jgi:hypothetical protein